MQELTLTNPLIMSQANCRDVKDQTLSQNPALGSTGWVKNQILIQGLHNHHPQHVGMIYFSSNCTGTNFDKSMSRQLWCPLLGWLTHNGATSQMTALRTGSWILVVASTQTAMATTSNPDSKQQHGTHPQLFSISSRGKNFKSFLDFLEKPSKIMHSVTHWLLARQVS